MYSGGALEDLVEDGEVRSALARPAQDPVLYCQKLFRIVLAPSLLLGLNLMQRLQKIWQIGWPNAFAVSPIVALWALYL